VANSRTENLLPANRVPTPAEVATALTDGFQRGYIVIALVAALALLVAVIFIRRDEVQVPEGEAALDTAPGA
jgi:hypothetical protein